MSSEKLESFGEALEKLESEALENFKEVSHCHMLKGDPQFALDHYKIFSKNLSPQDFYNCVLKDFDTLRWLGYYQYYENRISQMANCLGYRERMLYTDDSAFSDGQVQRWNQTLMGSTWSCRMGKYDIKVVFREGVKNGTATYYFGQREGGLLPSLLSYIPFVDEYRFSESSEYGRAFCQYRLRRIPLRKGGNQLLIEEFDPFNETIALGEILKLNSKELQIKILDNGNQADNGKIRIYKAE